MITSSPCCQLHGRRDLVVRRQLERVDHPQHLVEVAAGGHRIDQDQLDLLVRADHEDVADGLVVRRSALGRVALDVRRKHPVRLRDLELRIADQRIVGRRALRLLDVLRPPLVVVERVDRESDDLHAALVELRLDVRHVAELGGADRGEVARVGEQDGPGVSEPVVKVDPALGGVSLEVRRGVADRKSHQILRDLGGFAKITAG